MTVKFTIEVDKDIDFTKDELRLLEESCYTACSSIEALISGDRFVSCISWEKVREH